MHERAEYELTAEVAAEVARRVSVVAINYNGAGIVGRLADSVWASDAPPLELVVVDNASTDDSLAVLEARDDVVVVASPDNLGFGAGCMAGARAARGDLLLFVNPDVIFVASMLGALVGNLLASPSVAISFPKMVEPGEAHEYDNKMEDVSSSAGAVMLMSREHLERLGGFDPRIFLYYEETDFCWRTRLAGRRVTQDWQALAIHETHGAGGGPRWAAEQIANGLLVHIKLRPWPVVARFAAWMAVKTVIRGLQYRDAAVLRAWTTNVRRLPQVLAERRRIRGAASDISRAELEAQTMLGDFWRWHYRRQAARAAVRRALRR